MLYTLIRTAPIPISNNFVEYTDLRILRGCYILVDCPSLKMLTSILHCGTPSWCPCSQWQWTIYICHVVSTQAGNVTEQSTRTSHCQILSIQFLGRGSWYLCKQLNHNIKQTPKMHQNTHDASLTSSKLPTKSIPSSFTISPEPSPHPHCFQALQPK